MNLLTGIFPYYFLMIVFGHVIISYAFFRYSIVILCPASSFHAHSAVYVSFAVSCNQLQFFFNHLTICNVIAE